MSEVTNMHADLPRARVKRRLIAKALAFLAAALTTLPADAETVQENPGGQIVIFALHVAELRAANEPVEFDGACDSACTLYLSLPAEQLCITPRASFGFHLPYGVGAHENAIAAQYLISQYPDWVRLWIEEHGGLSHTIVRMEAAEAAKHLPLCGVLA
ncbi:hypothetical protein EOA75_17395 [Mesorhizobium sp. M1A.F.Ca.IN.022.07.1.1]|uniref:hypothetical protein n=2 Tax=Mesorhizobium TaxID=68287 RepID=UPI0009ED10C4|nr:MULTISPECIES: hypothetical protein [unclassified Mesorhizobium]WIE91566.1 hypothetical protein P9270_029395 [Mesorhizobium sp. WSM4875]RUV92259.1 hypothetical protein EOA75_17395 [Mesorhizobium sp. M1A.F.Ca.IN.022.07.1.1]RWG54842.1 MAG: hypothetical protein EOQ64_18835 [Mesorhizobium sp.]RWH29634.1 MAG: hypothetical protein EOQ76_14140 [Mesorhizobium sp.]RWH37229.1 MAG: hypothetical protein EOQ79_15210 [Mesorhizobium sp.]